jgi:hypothetical protein
MGAKGILSRIRRSDTDAIRNFNEQMNGQAGLRSIADGSHLTEGTGQITIAGVGDFMSSLLPPTLTSFERAGAASFVGQIYLGQANTGLREECMRAMPEQFRPRVTPLVLPAFPDGFGGAPPAEVRALAEWWETDHRRCLTRWGDNIARQTAITGTFPSTLLLYLSNNGHIELAPYVPSEFLVRSPLGRVFGILPIAKDTRVRHQLDEVFAAFGSNQPRGYLLIDNRDDQRRSDFGLVQLFAAMASGNWVSNPGVSKIALNGLNDVFPYDHPGQAAIISVVVRTAPVFYREPYKNKIPGVFHTNFDLLQVLFKEGIDEILADETLHSVPLRKAKKGSPRLLYAVAPVEAEALRRLAGDVDERIGKRLRSLDIDLTWQCASVGQPLAAGENAVITFVLIQGVDATHRQIVDYARGKLVGNPAVLSHARNGHAPRIAHPSAARQLTTNRKGIK